MIESEDSGQKTFEPPVLKEGNSYFIAGAAPTAFDDRTQGFNPGSLWYKTTVPRRLWLMTDDTEGAASWHEIPLSDYRTTRTLFDHYTDATTTGTVQENLYTYTMPLLTLAENGDKVLVEYAGDFTANTNTKRVFPIFDGNVLATGQTSSAAATDWTLDVNLIRVSNSVLRYAVEFTTTGDFPIIESGEITGLDLNGTGHNIDLDARSISAAGEVTAHHGFGVFYPAAPVTDSGAGLEFLGDGVTFLFDDLTFVP